MSKYNIQDLLETLTVSGAGKGDIKTMAAISLAENPGMDSNTNSPRNRDGSIDRGPFQINNKAHPDVTDQCAHDLVCSANAAYKISNGFTNFQPWTTYKSGAYKANLSKVGSTKLGGDSGFLGSGVGSPSGIPNPLKGIDAIASFLGQLFQSSTWFRVGKVVGGALLLLLGLLTLLRKDVVSAVSTVASPAGALAKEVARNPATAK
jgi:hypothetical protein